jgi:LAS superfamily LD-carboxypeptidase LdcB
MQYSSTLKRRLVVLSVFFFCLAVVAEARPRKRASRRSHGARVSALNPHARARLSAALGEMRRRGIRPRVTSAYRSRAEQRAIYACSRRRRCRARRGIYGARRPGTSLHERGLAVDLAGVARGGRRGRRLTPQGRQMVRVMRRHGFNWRYGLKDPAHFELHPRYARRSAQAAKGGRYRRHLAKYTPRGKRASRTQRRRA